MTQSPLPSLRQGYRALVFGASGGIGAAFARLLAADARSAEVFAASRRPVEAGDRIRPVPFDLEDEASIREAVAMAASGGEIDLVIVATGILHDAAMRPERSWRAIDPDVLARAYRINAIGPALVAKHALAHLPRDRKGAFAALSARVGSISDNRLGGWHAYRASKAALNMLVRTCAIELARRNPASLCVALHPGTVATELSRPFQANVARDRLLAPERSAASLLAVIDGLRSADSGKLFAWDGAEIPF